MLHSARSAGFGGGVGGGLGRLGVRRLGAEAGRGARAAQRVGGWSRMSSSASGSSSKRGPAIGGAARREELIVWICEGEERNFQREARRREKTRTPTRRNWIDALSRCSSCQFAMVLYSLVREKAAACRLVEASAGPVGLREAVQLRHRASARTIHAAKLTRVGPARIPSLLCIFSPLQNKNF